MSQTIPIQMPDGTVEQIDANTVVNAENALLESMRRPPAFHKIQMIPCRVDVERDVAVIKGGMGYIKHPARVRMAAAAGVRQVGAPRVWREEDDEGTRTCVEVTMNRPGFYDQPVTQQADGIESKQPQNIREHFTSKLITRATKKCLTVLLGESFLYDPAFLRERHGLFVFACLSEDTDDPDVKQVLLERMRGASNQLYAPAPATLPPPQPVGEPVALPSGNGVELEDSEDIDFLPASESASESGEWGAGGSPVNEGTQGEPGVAGTTSPAPLPEWVRSFARDRLTQAINWESIPPSSVEAAVRRGLKGDASHYPMDDDPAQVIAACKAAEWITAARRLYGWQTGGADNA